MDRGGGGNGISHHINCSQVACYSFCSVTVVNALLRQQAGTGGAQFVIEPNILLRTTDWHERAQAADQLYLGSHQIC